MNVTMSTSWVGAGQDATDVASAVEIAVHQDVRRSEETARSLRQQAQEERIELTKKTVEKLRDMARNALASGIFQGVTGWASAACTVGASLKEFQTAGLQIEAEKMRQPLMPIASGLETIKKQIQDITKQARLLGAAGQALSVLGKVDPFSIRQQFQAAEKQELEAEMERCSQRAQEQGDVESAARQGQGSTRDLLQKLHEARHAATMASLRV
jgi:hypothetical protein